MTARITHRLLLLLLALASLAPAFSAPRRAFAASLPTLTRPPAQTAETMRAALFEAQWMFASDPAQAATALQNAQSAYTTALAAPITRADPAAATRITAGFSAAQNALATGDAPAFAAARAQAWTALLAGSYAVVTQALQAGDGATAEQWLPVREFRVTSRFARPNANATRAVAGVVQGTLAAEDALAVVRADLLDAYQARLTEARRDLAAADQNGFAIRRAELAALAEGYFFILAPAYSAQRGAPALAQVTQDFAQLHALSVAPTITADFQAVLTELDASLKNFRAAPLTPDEQTRRANQLLRYLALVSVEYGRGVANGHVTRDFEIQEALTFRDGAAAAFTDLQSLLDARDPAATAQIAAQLTELETVLLATSAQSTVAAPEAVQARTDALTTALKTLMPSAWQSASSASDFDVIGTMLDQMEQAAQAGEYDLAESARLEAYALLEIGPEARLMVFAPQLKLDIESAFWNGQGTHKGLAYLIQQHAPYAEIQASRAALDAHLNQARTELGMNSAPATVATNAALIVFREGLEAVVILASLLSSMRRASERQYRRPLWLGVGLACVATAVTWLAAHALLLTFARYGERLEAVVSLVAIGVLLLITNWFFHQTYWTDWIAGFHAQKQRLLRGEAGLMLGLVMLGFTSVYREGFETVLFLQALVLEGGTAVVLAGVGAALALVGLVGLFTFKLQSALPYKRMLVVTGVLIGAVLLTMVGNTVHVLQVVGWLPIHLIGEVTLPYWLGTWFGLYPTWEGVGLQVLAAAFVIGSYYLAEHTHQRARQA